MKKRLLSLLLAVCMVLGMLPIAAFAAEADPFVSITTADGEAVTATFVKMVPAATEWTTYTDGAYYHVKVPAGTESVLVTYPVDVGILNDGSGNAWSYTLSVPDYVLGYGSDTFTVTANADGTNTVEIPIANYMLAEDGTGTAMSLEKSETYDPVTFFTFEYEEEEEHTHSYESAVTTEAACTAAGVMTYTCSCGDSYTEEIAATGHSYTDGACTVCGAKESTIIYTGSGEPHTQCYISTITVNGVEVDAVTADDTTIDVVLDSSTPPDQEIGFEVTLKGRYTLYLYYKEPTETTYTNKVIISKPASTASSSTGTLNYNLTDGALELSFKASHAQSTTYWTIRITTAEAHTCVFDQEVVSEDYLASVADCSNAATYYYSCECGEAGTETFSCGDALGHSYESGTCTVCGAEDPDYVAPDAETPFLSIVTNEGKDVTATFVKMVPAATEWAAYDDSPYYNVTVPAGTTSVLVTYPADVGILNDGNGTAWSYILSIPDYTLGYGNDTFTITTNDDGTSTAEIPVANYLLAEDGTGTAMSLEKSDTYDPITFFTFEHEAEDSSAETDDSVTVYFSISHDAEFAEGAVSGEVMALKEITVPYFDLALYGLEQFYFSSESYGDDGDGLPGSDLMPGTAEYAEGKVTMLHLFIYAVEVYHCGVDASEAGQGYLYNEGLMGTDVLAISGSTGSSFLEYIWGCDLNLNYYLNCEYPLASEGWGSTSDQILLEDGDIVTLGHFSNWSFFNDSTSIFNYMADGDVVGATTAGQGDQIVLSLYHAGPNMNGSSGTAQTPVDYCPDVYYAPVGSIPSGDVAEWTYLGTAESDGTILVDTSSMAPGQYIIAMAGQYGAENTEEICSTPGGILLTVEAGEEPEYGLGDVNMDGVIDTQDANLVVSYYYGSENLTGEQLALADVNADGAIDAKDANLVVSRSCGSISGFPGEA